MLELRRSFIAMVSLVSAVRRLLLSALCLGVIAYFGYHGFRGDYGLIAWYKLQDEAVELTQELDQVRKKREALEAHVALMRPESLDPDMLDQRAREVLNWSQPNDITILRRQR